MISIRVFIFIVVHLYFLSAISAWAFDLTNGPPPWTLMPLYSNVLAATQSLAAGILIAIISIWYRNLKPDHIFELLLVSGLFLAGHSVLWVLFTLKLA